jgi:hypothetical protein
MVDKRKRNARPSKYRPRTDAQRERRRDLWEARAADRKAQVQVDGEADLRARYDALQTALLDRGQSGIHGRRHSRPLDEITDDAERFGVLKARVERLEALWSINRRKRETRGKIIMGGALLAELIEAVHAGDRELLTATLDILDRRVSDVRDRLTLRDLLGDAPLPLRPGGSLNDPLEEALAAAGQEAPDFDALVQSAMAEETAPKPSEFDADYGDLDGRWQAQA